MRLANVTRSRTSPTPVLAERGTRIGPSRTPGPPCYWIPATAGRAVGRGRNPLRSHLFPGSPNMGFGGSAPTAPHWKMRLTAAGPYRCCRRNNDVESPSRTPRAARRPCPSHATDELSPRHVCIFLGRSSRGSGPDGRDRLIGCSHLPTSCAPRLCHLRGDVKYYLAVARAALTTELANPRAPLAGDPNQKLPEQGPDGIRHSWGAWAPGRPGCLEATGHISSGEGAGNPAEDPDASRTAPSG